MPSKNFFSYESLNARKEERRATYKIRRQVFFCPTSCSSQESEGFLFRRATYKGTYKEAVESARAGLSPQKGDVRKKIKRPRKVVCRHKKGTWEKHEKEKKRKRPRKARRWLPQRQGSVCPQPRISFLVHEYLGLKAARLVWSIGSCIVTRKPCAKEVPEMDYLRSESSTLKGLLYAPIMQEQYHKKTSLPRLKIPLQSICSKEGRTIALEQRVSEKAVFWQATINLY